MGSETPATVEKVAGVLSWTFSIQCLFAGAFILRTPAQHMRYFMIAISMLADFSAGLVGSAHSQGMWVRSSRTADDQCGILALRF